MSPDERPTHTRTDIHIHIKAHAHIHTHTQTYNKGGATEPQMSYRAKQRIREVETQRGAMKLERGQ